MKILIYHSMQSIPQSDCWNTVFFGIGEEFSFAHIFFFTRYETQSINILEFLSNISLKNRSINPEYFYTKRKRSCRMYESLVYGFIRISKGCIWSDDSNTKSFLWVLVFPKKIMPLLQIGSVVRRQLKNIEDFFIKILPLQSKRNFVDTW